jgi:hypothetical protein
MYPLDLDLPRREVTGGGSFGEDLEYELNHG